MNLENLCNIIYKQNNKIKNIDDITLKAELELQIKYLNELLRLELSQQSNTSKTPI